MMGGRQGGKWLVGEGELVSGEMRPWRGRGKDWQSLTVGTKDPGCFGADGERGRESEAEVERVSFYCKGDEGTTDPFFSLHFTFRKTKIRERCGKGAKRKKKRIWKEHERKKLSLNALRSSLFLPLPPSRTSLNLILNPLQSPPRNSILSFPVSILFYSLAFILSVFSVPSCASVPCCEIMSVPDEISQSAACCLIAFMSEWPSTGLLLQTGDVCAFMGSGMGRAPLVI